MTHFAPGGYMGVKYRYGRAALLTLVNNVEHITGIAPEEPSVILSDVVSTVHKQESPTVATGTPSTVTKLS